MNMNISWLVVFFYKMHNFPAFQLNLTFKCTNVKVNHTEWCWSLCPLRSVRLGAMRCVFLFYFNIIKHAVAMISATACPGVSNSRL